MKKTSKKTPKPPAKAKKQPQPEVLVPPKPASAMSTVVEELAELLAKHALTEIEYQERGERGSRRIRVSRGAVGVTTAAAPHVVAAEAPPGSPPARAETSDGNVGYITSPFVGTFYRSSNPDTAPFVDSGTRIKKGQVICIVEAMKLMNEIESEIDGVVLQCLVENGHPVEYGEPLFKIRND